MLLQTVRTHSALFDLGSLFCLPTREVRNPDFRTVKQRSDLTATRALEPLGIYDIIDDGFPAATVTLRARQPIQFLVKVLNILTRALLELFLKVGRIFFAHHLVVGGL
jgi:hypothetical protein